MSDKREGLATLPPVETVAREFVELLQETARTLPDAECLPEHTDVWQASDILDRCADRIETLSAKLKLAEAALERISAWEMPPTGEFWDEAKTRPMSYSAAYGSNGERDVVRVIARSALHSIRED